MFQSFLDENAHLSVKTLPFLNHLNIDNDMIEMYANAAGAADKGLGGVFRNEWFHAKWDETPLFRDGYSPNIVFLSSQQSLLVLIYGH